MADLSRFLNDGGSFKTVLYERGLIDMATAGNKVTKTIASNQKAVLMLTTIDVSGTFTGQLDIDFGSRNVYSDAAGTFVFNNTKIIALVQPFIGGLGEDLVVSVPVSETDRTLEYTLQILEKD
jgi:hypothetical protein